MNLASYLLLDAFREDCEVAIVVSNDADLKTPIELAISELGIDVGVLNPHRVEEAQSRPEADLSQAAPPGADHRQPVRSCPTRLLRRDSQAGGLVRPLKSLRPAEAGLAPSHRSDWGDGKKITQNARSDQSRAPDDG